MGFFLQIRLHLSPPLLVCKFKQSTEVHWSILREIGLIFKKKMECLRKTVYVLRNKHGAACITIRANVHGKAMNASLIPPQLRVNHHHHHVTLVARISLTLSRHSSLLFIALGRSSGQHPVSSHSC